jgi:hypothetical protein
MGLPSPDVFGLLALVRGQDRIQLPACPGDDRIDLRLDPGSDSTQLAASAIHNRIDPQLLFRGKTQLPSKPIAKLPVPRGMHAALPSPMLEGMG